MKHLIKKSKVVLSNNLGANLISDLPEDDLIELFNKLRIFARRCGADDPDELANSAVCRVLAGSRKLNPNYSLLENLAYIICSLAKNESAKNRRLVQLPDTDVVASGLAGLSLSVDHVTPADSFEAAEEQMRVAEQLVRRATELDESLGRILESALRLGWKPREIAYDLRIPVSAVYSGKRRLYRHRATLLKTMGDSAV